MFSQSFIELANPPPPKKKKKKIMQELFSAKKSGKM
jgi:hypothetical protein